MTADSFAVEVLEASPVEAAPHLLGAVLSCAAGDATVRVRITEVEAYGGADDPASHAYRGKTRRNEVMFGPAGHLYVYFVYGMHWCANVVCGSPDEAGAVLIRAGEVIEGIEAARERRPAARADRELAMGPARLASCLGLDIQYDGVDLCSPGSPVRLGSGRRLRSDTLPISDALQISDTQISDALQIQHGPRVGIRSAAERPWRFWLADDPTVSRYRPASVRPPVETAKRTGKLDM